MNEYLLLLILFLAGAAAAFINIFAGGGSMITIGLMITLGIDPSVANGTNRIGVLVGAVSGATAYKANKFTDLKQSLLLALCAIPGAIIGSMYSISISDLLFKRVLGVVMILILISLLIPSKKTVKKVKGSWLIYPAMFFVGLYGGFIQVGVGFILMASLKHLMAFDLVKTNMHKTFVVLIYSVPVILIFGISGNINWIYAVVISLGNALGSWISVKLALKKGESLVKIVLIIAILMMSAKFLFDI